MPRAVPIRTDIPAAELRRRAKLETDGRASRRMLALASALEGASREAAARQAGMDRQSLRARRGLQAASPTEVGGKGLLTFAGFIGSTQPASRACMIGRTPSRLTEGRMAAFRAVVLRGPDIEKDGLSSWTAKDLCRIVAARYKVSYSENGVLKLLKNLDLSWQKTRPVHPKADLRAQADFKKNSAV